jgi:uncharacterized protein YigE (DUF2233 family)
MLAALLFGCAALWATSLTWTPSAWAADVANGCDHTIHNETKYVVCAFTGDADLRLFLNDKTAEPYRHFNFVNDALSESGETLAFAMNAGMYHEDRSPVGLYIENGEELAPTNMNDGPGNFHLKPNGVFWIWRKDGVSVVHVTSAEAYQEAAHDAVAYATQSGPMLVINGEIHPRFLPDSDSLKRRNGVGVDPFGNVYFVLSDSPVRFYDFATYFRDELGTPNALYLDGTISRIYAPELDRNDPGVAMGPIVGVVNGESHD